MTIYKPLYELINLNQFSDLRGDLYIGELGQQFNMDIKRFYFITNLVASEPRGFHAHHKTRQIALCVQGSCTFVLDDGSIREEVNLTLPNQAITIETYVWHEMRDFSENCILLVLADREYSEEDYIKNYEKFMKERDKN